MAKYLLALDQGTTSSRAVVFDTAGHPVATDQEEFPQILPGPGLVEHDPEAIWSSQLGTAHRALAAAGIEPGDAAAIGIANQRETTLLWYRDTGRPVGNAIVWQSRVSAGICERLKAEGCEPTFRAKTGLLLDPYFSGTKVKHLLDGDARLRAQAETGQVLFGTVDTYLVWRLSGGRHHITDVSNASRTLMFNIHNLDWDDELLKILDVPRAMLPSIKSSSEVYCETDPAVFGAAVPIAGIAGDQQAATFGQVCFETGAAKNTYGTGCFLLMNTGTQPKRSENNLLSTVGWQIDGVTTYCLEGSIFIGGAVVQWLRDGLGIIARSEDVEELAASVPDSDGVYLVPAFVGLGAPYWDPYARGTIVGMTRGTKAGHLARAALESMAFQTRDVLEAMEQDAGIAVSQLKVDGGAAANDGLMQFQADILGTSVWRPSWLETTAVGAAYLAGLAIGVWADLSQLAEIWDLSREFQPRGPVEERTRRYRQWRRAVRRSLRWAVDDDES